MTRYHPLLVALHWLLAVMIVIALIAGNFLLAETPNSDPEKLFALSLHMSIGVAIVVLMLIRLITRVRADNPPHADTGNVLLNKAAGAAHVGLDLLVFAMGASGLALAYAAGLPAIVFGGSGAPLPPDFSEYLPRAAHGLVATLLALLVLAHVAGFAYHQLLLKDGLFKRMWFGNRRV